MLNGVVMIGVGLLVLIWVAVDSGRGFRPRSMFNPAPLSLRYYVLIAISIQAEGVGLDAARIDGTRGWKLWAFPVFFILVFVVSSFLANVIRAWHSGSPELAQ